MQITTLPFKSSRAQLLRTALCSRRFTMVWWLLALLVAAGTALALCVDLRWALVTAMVVLVLAPGVMALLYIDCMFSPRTLPGAYPHTVSFTDDAITVQATVPPLPDTDPGQKTTDHIQESTRHGQESTVSEQEPTGHGQEPKKLVYSTGYHDVAKLKIGLNSMAIILKGNPPGIILIPYDRLPCPKQDTARLIKKLQSSIASD